MGSWLYLERASVPTLIEMLSQRLNGNGQGEILSWSGNDCFQIQPFYDILNRRNGDVLHSGHRGFLMPKSDAEELLKLLSDLPQNSRRNNFCRHTRNNFCRGNQGNVESAAPGSSRERRFNGLGKALSSGADVNAHNQHKQSALNIAAEKGHLYAVAILLAADADIENLDVADRLR